MYKVYCLGCQAVYVDNDLILSDNEPPTCRYCECSVSLVEVEEGKDSEY